MLRCIHGTQAKPCVQYGAQGSKISKCFPLFHFPDRRHFSVGKIKNLPSDCWMQCPANQYLMWWNQGWGFTSSQAVVQTLCSCLILFGFSQEGHTWNNMISACAGHSSRKLKLSAEFVRMHTEAQSKRHRLAAWRRSKHTISYGLLHLTLFRGSTGWNARQVTFSWSKVEGVRKSILLKPQLIWFTTLERWEQEEGEIKFSLQCFWLEGIDSSGDTACL